MIIGLLKILGVLLGVMRDSLLLPQEILVELLLMPTGLFDIYIINKLFIIIYLSINNREKSITSMHLTGFVYFRSKKFIWKRNSNLIQTIAKNYDPI